MATFMGGKQACLLVVSYVCLLLLAMPCGMWDLSSPTQDQTQAPAMEAWSLKPWPARKSLEEGRRGKNNYTCIVRKPPLV